MVGLGWTIKPVYGLVSDFLPLGGSRRKGYLILMSALGLGSWLALAVAPTAYTTVLVLLMACSFTLAFADVMADALMVETGRPLGLTGEFSVDSMGGNGPGLDPRPSRWRLSLGICHSAHRFFRVWVLSARYLTGNPLLCAGSAAVHWAKRRCRRRRTRSEQPPGRARSGSWPAFCLCGISAHCSVRRLLYTTSEMFSNSQKSTSAPSVR